MPLVKAKVGERVRFNCDVCNTEFEIVHEPDYTDPALARQFGGKAKEIECCPFCGTDYTMLVRQ